MRFVTVKYNEREFIGIKENDKIIDLSFLDLPNTLIECIQMENEFIEKINRLSEIDIPSENLFKIEELEILAPIPRPLRNIICVGKNYRNHILETGTEGDISEHIIVFTKSPNSITNPYSTINSFEYLTEQLDYEGELAIIIGKTGQGIKEENALEYIFGYTILNDVSARDIQTNHKQFFLGKSLDKSSAMGPVIVHKNLIREPHNLQIVTKINDEVRQQGDTSQMLFTIPQIISTISKGMTLEVGDIIATGTPAGVGKGFNPPKYLKKGDEVEVYIEEIGTIKNLII